MTDTLKALIEAAQELADLVDSIRSGEYAPDSFTTQPVRIAIDALAARQRKQDAAPPVAMPAGWVPLFIEYEPGYPETVAFGPPQMMNRLKKWLDKYFAAIYSQQRPKPLTRAQRQMVVAAAVQATRRNLNLSWHDAIITEVERAHGIDGPATGVSVPYPLLTNEVRADLVYATSQVFDSKNPETHPIVRDVIEYVNSWLLVQIEKASDSQGR